MLLGSLSTVPKGEVNPYGQPDRKILVFFVESFP